MNLLGTLETSFNGLRTRMALKIFKLTFSPIAGYIVINLKIKNIQIFKKKKTFY